MCFEHVGITFNGTQDVAGLFGCATDREYGGYVPGVLP